jgi:hypothetical protein
MPLLLDDVIAKSEGPVLRPPQLMHPGAASCCLLPAYTSALGADCSLVRSSLSLLSFSSLTDMSCALLPY